MRFIRMNPLAQVPTYANSGDAGADLYSVDHGVLEPGERRLIDTGIAIEIPNGYAGFVHPRSGLAYKLGITVVNAPGTIDAGYHGNIKVNLLNTGVQPYSYCVGDRIAQIVFQKIEYAAFTELCFTEDREKAFDSFSARGVNGHGSTGGFNGRA
jgi:dUTP pyrophosphatase